MNDNEQFDANSEAYFNEKLHMWLHDLSPVDLSKLLKKWLSIPTDGLTELPTIFPWDSSDPSYTGFGRFDQRIEFGKSLCVILELKVKTKATIGQLKKYLEYIKTAGYRTGYVVLLSRNVLAEETLGYDQLKNQFPGLLFVTWKALEDSVRSLASAGQLEMQKNHIDNFLELLSFLTDQHKRSQKLLDQPGPVNEYADRILNALAPAAPPKKKDSILVWSSRLEFWNEVLDAVCGQIKVESWCTFRFDLYDWIIRWAFSRKRVFLDIYEDKNYEYYYHAFFTEVYPQSKGLPSAQLSDLYYRMLLVRDDKECLKTDHHRIFFHRQGKRAYFYAVSDSWNGAPIPYMQLFPCRF